MRIATHLAIGFLVLATACSPVANDPIDPVTEADAAVPAEPDADEGDVTAPRTTISSHPPAFSSQTRPIFEFTGSEAASFVCRLDDAAFMPCLDSYVSAELAEGEHTFEVYATDAAGNVESPPTYVRWVVDLTLPSVTVASGPGAFSGSEVTFNFDADEPVVGYECSLDSIAGGAFAACEPPVTYEGLATGARTFRVRATDRAGQLGPAGPDYTWTVDPSVFSASITAGPGSVSGKDVSFTFASTRPDSTFECSLDPAGAPVFTDCTSPKAYAGLSAGNHTFHVRAENPVGTFSTLASQTWRVDATGPTTFISDAGVPESGGWSTAASLTFSLSASEDATFECRLDDATYVVLAGASCELPMLADGAHTLTARATDHFGNLGAPASRSWITDHTAPIVKVPVTAPGCYAGSRRIVTFTATDENSILTLVCRVTHEIHGGSETLYDGPCTSATSFEATVLMAGWHYKVRISVTDPAGNPGSNSFSWTQCAD